MDFLCELLHCNNNILVNQKLLYIKNWVEKGVVHIFDLLKENGFFFNFAEFREKSPQTQGTFLDYFEVLGAVKKYQNKCKITLSEHISQETIVKTCVWSTLISLSKQSKQIYKLLILNCYKPSCIVKWNSQFQNLDWKPIFNNTVDTSLQWFQFKVVHRILVTNYTLQKMKIRDDNKCTFCENFPETIEHLLSPHFSKKKRGLCVTVRPSVLPPIRPSGRPSCRPPAVYQHLLLHY